MAPVIGTKSMDVHLAQQFREGQGVTNIWPNANSFKESTALNLSVYGERWPEFSTALPSCPKSTLNAKDMFRMLLPAVGKEACCIRIGIVLRLRSVGPVPRNPGNERPAQPEGGYRVVST